MRVRNEPKMQTRYLKCVLLMGMLVIFGDQQGTNEGERQRGGDT
jgi:hypothetical protein